MVGNGGAPREAFRRGPVRTADRGVLRFAVAQELIAAGCPLPRGGPITCSTCGDNWYECDCPYVLQAPALTWICPPDNTRRST